MSALLALGVMQAMVVTALIAQWSKRRRVEHALRTSVAALRSSICETQTLAGRLIVSQESERRRIARDLHDNLGQKLSLLCIDIDRLRGGGTGPAIVEAAARLSDRAHDIASDVHLLSHGLHPPALEILGLAPAVDSLCRDVASRCRVRVAFRHVAIARRLPTDVALCLFRITQEALQNVVHHSGAATATVRLAQTRHEIRLHIADDGHGFSLASKTGAGLGLVSMRERARFAGGRIAIRSVVDRGTRIVVRLPMQPNASGIHDGHTERRIAASRQSANQKGTVRTTVHKHRRIPVTHLPSVGALVVAVCGVLGTPAHAFAQADQWQVSVAPLYFWAATTDGNLAVNGARDIPVHMDFDDAASKLAGAFSFHGEARKGRWGAIGDINFIRLSTDVSYTTPMINAPIAGTLQFDQIIFNGKGTYEVKPGTRFLLVGGIRTLTMSPNAHFTGPVGGQLADIDISATHVAGVAGFSYRPRLSEKVVLLAQADVGGGSAFTWSAAGGVEFLLKPWIGLAVGYNALRIDTGNVPKSGSGPVNDVQYAVTQYGPAFSLTFHWSEK